jgi:Mor family transcriptional regulator
MPDEWTRELTPSMLPEGMYRKIAEEIGADNLLKLAALIGGSTFYFQKQKQILRPLRDKKIREEYNGYNYAELAKKYDVSERWAQQVANQKDDKEDK